MKTVDGCECVDTSQILIVNHVGINNLNTEKSFKIYPNPNTGNFTIEIENPSKDASIEIFNLMGKLIKTVETSSSKSIYEIDLNSADGIYLVKVKNNGVVWNKKVLVSFGVDTKR